MSSSKFKFSKSSSNFISDDHFFGSIPDVIETDDRLIDLKNHTDMNWWKTDKLIDML